MWQYLSTFFNITKPHPQFALLLHFMKKWMQKILLSISVIVVLGHGIIPHHHHEVIQEITQHHHDDEEQRESKHHHDHDENKDDEHGIFSFAQLDENFVPAKWQHISIELPFLYLVTPVIIYQYNLLKLSSKTHFGYYKEFPPPGNHLPNLPSRAPPAC